MILPCPFCGWEMVGVLTRTGVYGDPCLVCSCERCNSRGPYVQASQYTEADAIEVWNRRAPHRGLLDIPIDEEAERIARDACEAHRPRSPGGGRRLKP